MTFTNNNGITIKLDIDEKVDLYCYCIYCGFEKFAAIDKEELNDLLKRSNYI